MSPHSGNSRSGGRLEEYAFTFESYLDGSARIEPDPNPSVNASPDSQSLTESIYNYHRENGRTYHSYRAGSYHFPNDHLEVERLNDQHEILKLVLDNRNYTAPLSHSNPPRKILDICTGTGIWAIEMGDEFPMAQIIGIDLSPIQPNIVPPNVEFYVEDATDEWHERDVDYIHNRFTLGCWSDMKKELIENAFRALRPGGWLESVEPLGALHCDDGTMANGCAFKIWCDDIIEASRDADRPVDMAPMLKQWFEEVGFVDVHEKVYKLPINGWPLDQRLKMIGKYWKQNLEAGLAAFSYGLFHRILNKSKAEIEVELVGVRRDISDQRLHAYQKMYVVYGRKPDVPRTSGDHSMTGQY